MQEQGVLVTFCAFRCNNNVYLLIWAVLSVAFKLVIHSIAIVLAFLVRKIEFTALDNSTYTLAIIYTSSVINILLVVFLFALLNYKNLSTVAFSTLIFVDSMTFLSLTFIPTVSD